MLISCNTTKEVIDEAIVQAENNSKEIELYLNNYSDREHADIAEYLVCGMIDRYGMFGAPMDSVEAIFRFLNESNKWCFTDSIRRKGEEFCKMQLQDTLDLRCLSSKFLIDHTDDAIYQWKSRKWNENVSEDIFIESILPYRIGDEEATLWRKPYRSAAIELEESLRCVNNSVDAARIISNKFGPTPYNPKMKTPHRSALNLLEAPVGICREDCDRTVYAMRSFGVPVAIDILLVSPDYGGDHMWNVVYDSEDDIFRMFDNNEYPPTRDSIHNDKRKKGKVYRYTWIKQSDRLRLYKNAKNAPASLLNPNLKDVTNQYFGNNRVAVPLFKKYNEVYLGIFTPSGCSPIDIATYSNKKAVFKNIEPNLIYFPVSMNYKSEYVPVGYPFYINDNKKLIQIIPKNGNLRKVSLVRKMPVGFLMDRRQKLIDGFSVYVSENENGPWRLLDIVCSKKDKIFHSIRNSTGIKERYIRIVSPDSLTKELGEFIVSSDSVGINTLPISIVGDPKDLQRRKKLIDGDVLSRYLYEPIISGDIILHVDSPENIGGMFLLPRNDDNSVRPGEVYELFYFSNKGWVSLGRKEARGFEIEYEVPQNSLLWLRNLSHGKEEQIFIMKDDKQVFNYDL